jgi:hexokinase
MYFRLCILYCYSPCVVVQTVGALLSRAYSAGGCVLGAIFGTGTNGAYVEQVSNITKLGNSPAASKGGVMVVNMEWGAFNNSVGPTAINSLFLQNLIS